MTFSTNSHHHNNETLHLIIDTDWGLDDMCAILYLLYEQFSNPSAAASSAPTQENSGHKKLTRRHLVIHHISLCQGQQLDTKAGMRQLYSMLKYCNIPMAACTEKQFENDAKSEYPKVTLSYGPNKESLFESEDHTDEEKNQYIHHHFPEGDFYTDEFSELQNNICQHIDIPLVDENQKWEVEIMENDAVEELLRLVKEKPNFYSLFAIGPLTNISLVLQKDPEWLSRLRHVYFMAGNFLLEGNTGGANVSEWNIYADPKSARHVFDHMEKYPFLTDHLDNLSEEEKDEILEQETKEMIHDHEASPATGINKDTEEKLLRHCKVLGLEVAHLNVFPEEIQTKIIKKGKEERIKKEREGSLPPIIAKNWSQIQRITETMERVMLSDVFSCTFDVVAAMAMMRSDVVHEYHRVRFTIERRKPREGQCVVLLHHTDNEEELKNQNPEAKDRIVEESISTSTQSGNQLNFQRSIHIKEISGTDFESVSKGALVDIGIQLDEDRFRNVIGRMLACREIPSEDEWKDDDE